MEPTTTLEMTTPEPGPESGPASEPEPRFWEEVTTHWPSGRRHKQYQLVDGKIDGVWSSYSDAESEQKSEECGYKLGVRHGPYGRWYPNGQRDMDATYHDGLLEGKVTKWNVDGKCASVCEYKGGRLNGESSHFSIGFTIAGVVEKCQYRDDILDGLYTKSENSELYEQRHYKKGQCVSVKIRAVQKNRDRQIFDRTMCVTEYTYGEGKRNGPYTVTVESSGRVIEKGFYRDDRLDGPFCRWSPSGVMFEEGTYKDDQLDGRHIYHEYRSPNSSAESIYVAGELRSRTTWSSGIGGRRKTEEEEFKDGLTTIRTWTADRLSERTTRHSHLEGPQREWTLDGKLLSENVYHQGTLVKIKVLCDEKGRDCALKEGEILVWKACRVRLTDRGRYGASVNVYVQIRVPPEARRVTPHDPQRKYKCRVEYGTVEQIVDSQGTSYPCAYSFVASTSIVYTKGEVVRGHDFDDRIDVDCGAGINVHVHRDHCDQWFQ